MERLGAKYYNNLRNSINMNNLKKIIDEKGLSIVKVATEASISDSTLYNYIKSERIPSVATLVELSRVLNTSTDYLLWLTNNPIKTNDIDTYNNKIYLKHSINYDRKSNQFVNSTKNESSSREIDISPIVSNEIIKYKDYLKLKGYNVNDNNLIFLNYKTEKTYTDTTLRNQFHDYCDKAGVRWIRLYDLRHTYVATMMAEGKELYLISERLGHSSFATTVNKYGHLSNDVRKEMALATDKYL